MDPISQNLKATQNLLNALEKNPKLLKDDEFMRKISILRLKHEETTNYLAAKMSAQCSSHENSLETFSNHNQSIKCYQQDSQISNESINTMIRNPQFVTSSQVVEENYFDDGLSTTREVSKIIDEINPTSSKLTKPINIRMRGTNEKMKKIDGPKQINELFHGRATIPKPFQLSLRRSIENSYAKKFINEMMTEKEKAEKLKEEEMKKQIFKAKPVPETTYHPQNNYLNDQKYIASMRRKVAAAAKRKFEQQNDLIRSKSENNLSLIKPAGYVPPTTYISPIPLTKNTRSRSATTRAVRLIQEATTPKGLKKHQNSSNFSFSLRHNQCKFEKRATEIKGRTSPPNFSKIHAKNDSTNRRKSPKPTTVPTPFKFASRSPSASSRHQNCGERNVEKYSPINRRSYSGDGKRMNSTIPTTNAAQLRQELNRAKLEKEKAVQEKLGEFWKDDNRKRISAFLGSRSKTEEDIAMRTKQKIKEQQETTKEYMKQLSEMKQRVLNGPLIMEKQSVLAQEHRFQKKYEQRMKNAKEKGNQILKRNEFNSDRRESEESAGTFVIHNRSEEKEEYDDDFEKTESSTLSDFSPSKSKNSSNNSSSSSSSSFRSQLS